MHGLAEKEQDSNIVWRYLKEAYGTDYFLNQIEREYSKRFIKDYNALYKAVEKLNKECKLSMDELTEENE